MWLDFGKLTKLLQATVIATTFMHSAITSHTLLICFSRAHFAYPCEVTTETEGPMEGTK